MPVSGRRLPATIASSDGLQIRRWLPQDAEILDELVRESLAHLRPWMPWAADEPIRIDQCRAMLDQWEADWRAGGDVLMGIFAGQAAVGGCGLHRRIGPGGLEVGYWVHPQHLRQRIATRATSLLIDAAFSVPDLTHVEIHNDKANTASAGVPRKLGFVLIDERPDAPAAPAEIGIEQRWRMHRDDGQSRPSPQLGRAENR